MKRVYRDTPCNGCTECCRNENITLQDEELNKFAHETHVDKDGTEREVLKHKENGDCVYLDSNGCTRHKDKPAACDAFDCLFLLQTAGLQGIRQLARPPVVRKAIERFVALSDGQKRKMAGMPKRKVKRLKKRKPRRKGPAR